MINGKQLKEQGIITNVLDENVQQIGIDLNVIKIEKINTTKNCGWIPESGKTIVAHYDEVSFDVYDGINLDKDGKASLLLDKKEWALVPGVYSVTFAQGCKIPNNIFTLIRQRSSLLRNGAMLHSSVFDPGYFCDNIISVLYVHEKIVIEYNARIGQMYGHIVNTVENLYEGQWQGGKERHLDIEHEK